VYASSSDDDTYRNRFAALAYQDRVLVQNVATTCPTIGVQFMPLSCVVALLISPATLASLSSLVPVIPGLPGIPGIHALETRVTRDSLQGIQGHPGHPGTLSLGSSCCPPASLGCPGFPGKLLLSSAALGRFPRRGCPGFPGSSCCPPASLGCPSLPWLPWEAPAVLRLRRLGYPQN
jgi:hypothetical protein